jgi:hypothetical protein
MKSSARPAGPLLAAILLAVAAAAALGGGGPERTLFKDIPPSNPVREVIQAVLASPFYSMRQGFLRREWVTAGLREAWERARRYFPDKTYFVRPGTYFMTHGFDPDGRLFMEVHDSAYLALCVENRRTFTPDAIVREYGRMLDEADGREAAAFREKLGRLDPFFRDGQAFQSLRKTLGAAPLRRLLGELREEDYHMLAGGLMHEGMHAGMNDALVARVQAEFKAGVRPVQWDELRAFMAEVGYHAPFSRWAERDIAVCWEGIKASLGELEALRRTPGLGSGPDRTKLEKARTEAWVCAALVRLRMREIWQSARRMQDLLDDLRKDYVRSGPPADVEGLLAKLARDTAGFVAAAAKAIPTSELALRSLEGVLDQWGEWAAGSRPFPPPVTDSQAIFRQVKDIRWPDPAADAAAALMKKAGEALEKERISS